MDRMGGGKLMLTGGHDLIELTGWNVEIDRESTGDDFVVVCCLQTGRSVDFSGCFCSTATVASKLLKLDKLGSVPLGFLFFAVSGNRCWAGKCIFICRPHRRGKTVVPFCRHNLFPTRATHTIVSLVSIYSCAMCSEEKEEKEGRGKEVCTGSAQERQGGGGGGHGAIRCG